MVLLQVSLAFSQPLGQADHWSDVPHVEASSDEKCGTTSGQLDNWSALGVRLITLVRCTLPGEASSGQEWYYFRSA